MHGREPLSMKGNLVATIIYKYVSTKHGRSFTSLGSTCLISFEHRVTLVSGNLAQETNSPYARYSFRIKGVLGVY